MSCPGYWYRFWGEESNDKVLGRFQEVVFSKSCNNSPGWKYYVSSSSSALLTKLTTCVQDSMGHIVVSKHEYRLWWSIFQTRLRPQFTQNLVRMAGIRRLKKINIKITQNLLAKLSIFTENYVSQHRFVVLKKQRNFKKTESIIHYEFSNRASDELVEAVMKNITFQPYIFKI